MNVEKLRKDFPILKEKLAGRDVIYFDNAATSQKPQQMLDALFDFYTKSNANIHRSINGLAEKATQLYEDSRKKIANFIGAMPEEIIFTSGTTGGINLVAESWAMGCIRAGDEIVVTEMEHHSNLIPWQQVAFRKGATLKFIPVGQDLKLDLSNLSDIITEKTKLVAVIHVSNVLGTHVDVKKIGAVAKAVGAKFLIDAAQSSPHQKLNVGQLGCDFLAFSGHKMLAPTGIGCLYLKKELQQEIPPYQFGGGMVFEVDYEKATWCPTHRRFEAGTQSIAQAIGLGAAVDYLQEKIDFDQLQSHQADLCSRTLDGLLKVEGIKILGPQDELRESGHLVSFLLDGIHSHDVAAFLSSHGICARAGHNCVQPLAKKLGYDATVRVSFYFYNTAEEVDFFLEKMREIRKSFGV